MSVSYYRGNEVPEMNYNITVDAELQEKSVTIKNNGTTVISPDGNYNALSEVTVNVNIEAKADPILQSKTIDITENGNTIVSPDSGYDGLSEVSVNVTVASSGGESSEKEDPEIQTLIETAGNENNFYTSPKGGNLRNTYLLTGDYVLSGLWSYWYYDTETQEYKPQRTPDGRDYFAPYYDAWALEKIRNSGYSLTIYHDNKYYPFSEFLGKPIFRDGSSYISSSNDYYQDFDGEWRDYEYFYWWGYDLAYRDSWGSEYIIENPYDYGSYSLKPTVKPGGYFVWYEPVERSITDKLDTYYSSKEIKNFKGGIVPWHFSLGNSNISDCGGVTDGILTVNIGTASSYYDGSTDFSGIGFLLLRKDGVYYNAEDVVWNLASSQKIYYKGIGKIKEVKININNLASRFKDFKNLKKIEKISCKYPITNLSSCFSGCSSLTSFPELNTEKVTDFYQMIKGCTSLTRIEEISFKSMGDMSSSTGLDTGNISLRYLLIKDIGTNPACASLDFSGLSIWGNASDDVPDARQSLIDSLLTYSFDRATAGYSTCTITLYGNVKALLTEDEIAQIQAKGYTIS